MEMSSKPVRSIGLMSLRRFSDEEERAFLEEYRSAALHWAMCASLVGAAVFGLFMFVSWWFATATLEAQLVRFGSAVYFFGTYFVLRRRIGITLSNYVVVASITSVVALCSTILLLYLPGSVHGEGLGLKSPTALVCGIFMVYGFLRLPLTVSASVGFLVSGFALMLGPESEASGEATVVAVYLLFANMLGVMASRLIESRERDLFFQRRLADAARAEARDKQARAEEADREKTRLIAAVSHDLRQPMAAAVAYLDVLQSRIGADDLPGARVQAEKAHAAVDMLGSTLDHLLTAARYDSGTEPIAIETMAVAPLVRGIVESYSTESWQRNVRLRLRLPRRSLAVTTDGRSLQRLLGNLISNALKFTDSTSDRTGKVLVSVRHHGGMCRIDVIDTGIGIAPEQQAEIWKPYVQLNNVERDRARGLGLGLFLVQRIVEQLPGHSVALRSRPGHGTAFTVTLPAIMLADRPPVLSESPVRTPSRLDLSMLAGAYVFLVEDDRDARLALAELLGTFGVVTVAGATLSQVLAEHGDSERLVDAIVCDYRLSGGLTGFDAIAALRTRLGYSPHAVLITGEAALEPLLERAGPDLAVLRKPFGAEDLAAPLLRAVEAARQLEDG